MSETTHATRQLQQWTGDFGRDYTDRNTLNCRELDSLFQANFGITRTALNEDFLGTVPKSARILEVGCNCGNQLLLLQEMGFTDLGGVEVQSYAVERARSRIPTVNLV